MRIGGGVVQPTGALTPIASRTGGLSHLTQIAIVYRFLVHETLIPSWLFG